MKYLSTFSGIGGFELGIQLAYERNLDARGTTSPSTLEERRGESVLNSSDGDGWGTDPTCIGYSEIDKYATAIYQKHFPEHKNYGDITKINADELPDFDLLVGGFPCQAFSIAGKRGGFEDTRGTMFFELARILRAKQPRLFVFENVKGLLSHDGGKSFATIIQTLDELGYDCQWQVLNSKNHGVPQNRERVFIIGHLRGTPRPQVFPFGADDEISTDTKGGSEPEAKHTFSTIATNTKRKESNYIQQLNQPTHSNDRVYGIDGVSPTLNTMQGGNRQPFIMRDGRDNRSCLRAGRTPELGIVGHSIRRLTPTECMRLQGFPDDWCDGLGISDTQKYKVAGNAVTVNVIRDIFEKII